MIERRIAGIPCLIDVTHYSPGRPMRITGSGFGDADPPEPAEVEYEVCDRKGYRAEWLERKITTEMDDSIRAMLIDKLEQREHEYE